MVALQKQLELPAQRIGMRQIAVQSRIPDFVACRENSMISDHCGTGTGRVAQVAASREGGKHDVLQSRADESQGLPFDRLRRIVLH